MRAPIERLHASIREVYEFLAYARGVDGYRTSGGFSGADPPEGPEIAKYLASPSWRRHAYAFAIVNTYGAHERFMRDLVEGAAGVYATSYQTYDQMPEDLQSSHLRFSVGHAREILEGRTNAGEDIKSVIGNLAACLAGSTNLNRTALSSSSANFRVSVIRDVLLRIGLRISTDEADWELREITRTDLNGLYGSASAVIDDLANRRNEVAHGNDYEILDIGCVCVRLLDLLSGGAASAEPPRRRSRDRTWQHHQDLHQRDNRAALGRIGSIRLCDGVKGSGGLRQGA